MLDIARCIEDRNGLAMSGDRDDLVELLFSDEPDDCMFVTFEGFFDKAGNQSKIPEGYKLRCSFELGSVLTGAGVKLALFWFSKSEFDECRFGVLKIAKPLAGRPCAGSYGFCSIPADRFSDEYRQYLASCESFANRGSFDDSLQAGTFFSMPVDELVAGRFTPSFYAPEMRKIRAELNNAETVKLGDVAEVLNSVKASSGANNVLLLKPKNIRFPVDLSNLERGDATTVLLQRGDIILRAIGENNRTIVFDREDDEPVYAGTSTVVIRAHGLSPEYLCFYLSSEVAKATLSSLSTGTVYKRLTLKVLKSFPVVVPSMDDEYYRAQYSVLAGFGTRDYRDINELKSAEPKPVESILDIEIAARIDAYHEEQLREFLTSDIEELNTCFSHGAYKAAIILAGSILEAVLIDWLSEIKHVNYFEEDYYVYDHRNGRNKRADLFDYINEIKYIEKPRWANEAKMAHAIRKKRNLVHAKLCIASDDVNEETARMVIDYLDQVLRTRGAHCVR